ncbi:ATP-binding protein, partial [Streptomyces olindensis]
RLCHTAPGGGHAPAHPCGPQLIPEGPTGPAAELLGGLPVQGLPTHGLPVNGVPVG